jgi:hypothetical protein
MQETPDIVTTDGRAIILSEIARLHACAVPDCRHGSMRPDLSRPLNRDY